MSSFEVYLDRQAAVVVARPARCEGCFREDLACWKLGHGNHVVMCEACLRTFHGDEMGEERTLRALLGAAVTAALESGASARRIRTVVDQVIDEDIEREMNEQASALMRAMRATRVEAS